MSDTLLAEYSDDEIEVILAHELGHHVHRDIWTALAVETLIVAAVRSAPRARSARWRARRRRGPADVAAPAAARPGRRAACRCC